MAFTNLQLRDKFNHVTFSVHADVFNGFKCFNKATFSTLKCQLMLHRFVSPTKLNSAPVRTLIEPGPEPGPEPDPEPGPDWTRS